MIPFDFDYYRPETLEEAVRLFGELDAAGENPVWYGGGSELLSMARVGAHRFGAVVDIKGIPECRICGAEGGAVRFGAALTLGEIIASDLFPLLSKTAGRIADHTMQNRITLGGNLAASIVYREAALPLLLADAELTTAGPGGLKRAPFEAAFSGAPALKRDELIVSVSAPESAARAPYFHQKKTKNEKIDYPLMTAAATVTGGRLRIAFSGLAPFPFRDKGAEEILNDGGLDIKERARRFAGALSGMLADDYLGSAGYRKFVLEDTVEAVLRAVKEERLCLL